MVKDPAANELADPPPDPASEWRAHSDGIYAAIATAAGEMKAIEKDQQNTGQGFKFRSIETIVGHAKPILAKHEISITPNGFEVISSEEVKSSSGSRGYRVVVYGGWQIGHSDGSFIEAAMLGEAIDYGDKATSKAVQMAYKYLLTQMLGIGSEDPDSESPDAGEVVSPAGEMEQRTNAVKAALLKEADGDKEAAGSLWDGILDHLGYSEPLKQSQLKKVEAAIADRPPVEPS